MREESGFTAVIIDRENRAESKLMLAAFSPEEGLVYLFKKMSAKKTSAAPDLFDEIACEAQSAGGASPVRFLKEFETIKKRAGIAASYQKLCAAAEIAATARLNGENIEERREFAALVSKSLDAVESSGDEDSVKIKFLYAFAKMQGYPVREDFFASLPADEKARFAKIINTPANALDRQETQSAAACETIRRWIEANTDILLPKPV